MRVVRFHVEGDDRVGLVVEDGADLVVEARAGVPTDTVALLARPDWTAALAAAPVAGAWPLEAVHVLAPVPRPPTFWAIARNYAAHAAERGAPAPTFPTFFTKASTCVNGPFDDVVIPTASDQVDYEGELGVVIGRRCRRVAERDALSVVAGYTIIDDVSCRDWQAKAATFVLGKSWDTHGPMGPWVVTPDEIDDPHDLGLRTFVNDELRQDGHTGDMLHSIGRQIEVLSTVCTLQPGDVVSTGTPAGVGAGLDPPVFLRPGDVVRIEIDSIGTMGHAFVAEA